MPLDPRVWPSGTSAGPDCTRGRSARATRDLGRLFLPCLFGFRPEFVAPAPPASRRAWSVPRIALHADGLVEEPRLGLGEPGHDVAGATGPYKAFVGSNPGGSIPCRSSCVACSVRPREPGYRGHGKCWWFVKLSSRPARNLAQNPLQRHHPPGRSVSGSSAVQRPSLRIPRRSPRWPQATPTAIRSRSCGDPSPSRNGDRR